MVQWQSVETTFKLLAGAFKDSKFQPLKKYSSDLALHFHKVRGLKRQIKKEKKKRMIKIVAKFPDF